MHCIGVIYQPGVHILDMDDINVNIGMIWRMYIYKHNISYTHVYTLTYIQLKYAYESVLFALQIITKTSTKVYRLSYIKLVKMFK